jgi:hypothetical protein
LKNSKNPDSLNEKEVEAWGKRFVREWVAASGDEKGLKDNYSGRGRRTYHRNILFLFGMPECLPRGEKEGKG